MKKNTALERATDNNIKIKQEDIGKRIKLIRKRRGMTLENLYKKTNLSVPLLSQIEHGLVNLSIANLWKISQALEVEIEYFFQKSRIVEEFELIRSEERVKVIPHHTDPGFPGYSHEHLASFITEGTIEVFAVGVKPLSEEAMKFNKHPGMEFNFVLEGEVEFRSGDYREILAPGDSLRFSGKSPHAYRALGKKAKLLAILYFLQSQER